MSERQRQADDCEWESVCRAKQESDQISSPHCLPWKENTQSPCRKSAVLTFLSVLSLLSLTWKAGTKQHGIRSQQAVVNRGKQIHAKIIGDQSLIISMCRVPINLSKSCYISVLYQKPWGEYAFTFKRLPWKTEPDLLGNDALRTHTHTHTENTVSTIVFCLVSVASRHCFYW